MGAKEHATPEQIAALEAAFDHITDLEAKMRDLKALVADQWTCLDNESCSACPLSQARCAQGLGHGWFAVRAALLGVEVM